MGANLGVVILAQSTKKVTAKSRYRHLENAKKKKERNRVSSASKLKFDHEIHISKNLK